MSDPDPFRIRAHVPDFEAISAAYKAASDAARTSHRWQADIAYGSDERERLDLFFPDEMTAPAPVHMFVHGGYWRANVKEDYAFVAASVLAAGGIAAVVEYGLMPKMRMAALVDQVRRAAGWLAANAEGFNGDPGALSASGHSAGAHLASYLAARGPGEPAFPPTPVKSLLLVSGIYDLRPITKSFLQPEIGLTPDEVAAWSPIEARQHPGTATTLAVGADETLPFHTQATLYAARGSAEMELSTLPGLNHMTIVADMGVRESMMGRLVAQCIEASRR